MFLILFFRDSAALVTHQCYSSRRKSKYFFNDYKIYLYYSNKFLSLLFVDKIICSSYFL